MIYSRFDKFYTVSHIFHSGDVHGQSPLVRISYSRTSIQRFGAVPFPDTTPTPSLHPNGTKAAATLPRPLSVASRLYCAAAFLVSCISTWIPSELIAFLVAGLSGIIFGPNPRINKSMTCQSPIITPSTRLPRIHNTSFGVTHQVSATPFPELPNSRPQPPTALYNLPVSCSPLPLPY